MILASTIKQRALDAGFDLAGIAPPSALKDLEFLPRWLKKGFGGEMHYLEDPRREDPCRVLPSVKSIICVGLIYNTPHPYSTDIVDSAKDGHPRAWISRYAWGEDYHDVIRNKLEELRAAIEKLAPNVKTRTYVDTGPLLERAFARLSGIGWMGKNTCLINEGKGSWFFLGVILTNLELQLDVPAPDRCGTCTRCLEACPTGALVEPYVMDASRCISYFTIELKGTVPEEFRTAIGKNVFGCDICQDVCPWNSRPLSVAGGFAEKAAANHEQPATGTAPKGGTISNLPAFQPLQVKTKSCGPVVESMAADKHVPVPSGTQQFSLFNPIIEELASITENDFRRAFAHSPIKRAKYRGWLRNLCIVMGNSGDRQFIPWLETATGNPDPLVREHAAWALGRLQGDV